MKLVAVLLVSVILVIACATPVSAQYYYRDIIGTQESNELIRNYMKNNVQRVVLTGYDADGTKNDGLKVSQQFSQTKKVLVTYTTSGEQESILSSYFNAEGQVVKSVDSSSTVVTTSTYTYNEEKFLTHVNTRSADSSKNFVETEEHRWEYRSGKPALMTKIKNGKATEIVKFKLDEKGNVIEEQSFIHEKPSEAVQYFYDSQGRLTDIVRYNTKVRKLLPEYLFEYSPANQVIQKITVPSNSSDYLIWRYQYDNKGLKVREAIFDKQKQLNGKVEYQYVFGE